MLFLDFDGVLHPAGGKPGEVLPFEWLPQLAAIVGPFRDVGVVVHSSWRDSYSEEYMRDFLEPLGDAFKGVAPPGHKAHAIRRYLEEHPEIGESVVLDDQAEELPSIRGVQILVCDPSLGVSCPRLQERLVVWLKGGSTN
ncbi:HAD domain-containing protein [Roseateles sp. UC29_93]|uniref:HAD domain-containing protein n=1 Tax=Roseateles sp. UC29_93 TaxID=3350177 RepID=UPI0036721251